MLNTINDENTDQDVGGVETQLHRKTRTTYHAGLENNVAMKHIPTVNQLNHANQWSEIMQGSNQGIGPT